MTFPGTDAGGERPVDPQLARALSHPLRQRILERLSLVGEASPKELSGVLGGSIPVVAYHVRVLLELGCVELARTRHVRGALEHHYRATAGPWFDLEQWAKLPVPVRRQAFARTLRDILAAASEAGVAGGFDHPQAMVRRVTLQLDPQGWQELSALLEQTLKSLEQIHADSVSRTSEAQTHHRPIDAEAAVLLFRRDSSATRR